MNKILEIKFGSHLYGTDTPESDLDLKAIYLPTAKEIVLGNYKKTISKSRCKLKCERNNKDDIDIEIFSLDRYLELLMEGQTVALDLFFAPPSSYTYLSREWAPIWQKIFDNREKLLTRNVNSFVGYAKQQAARYGIKGSRMDSLKRTMEMLERINKNHLHEKLHSYQFLIDKLVKESSELISLEKTPLVEIIMLKGPKGLVNQPHLRINNRAIPFHATVKYAKEIVTKMLEGYGQRAHKANLAGAKDWKAISHACRVNSEALELLSTGHITFPRPDKEILLSIKLGLLPYEYVAEMIEQGVADLYIAHKKSTLREEADREWANGFIYDVYSKIVIEG